MCCYRKEKNSKGRNNRNSKLLFIIMAFSVIIILICAFLVMNRNYSKEVIKAISTDDNVAFETLMENKKFYSLNMPVGLTDIVMFPSSIVVKTPLQVACVNGKCEMAESLINHGADVNCTILKEDPPLICALVSDEKGREEMVRMLVEYGADCDKRDSSGYTPLLRAACSICVLTDEEGGETARYDMNRGAESLRIYRYLLEYADEKISSDTEFGDSALHLAADCYNRELVDYLINEQKIDINVLNNAGETALFLSPIERGAEQEALDTARMLIDNGIDLTIKNEDGYTAYGFARMNGNDRLAVMIKNAQ